MDIDTSVDAAIDYLRVRETGDSANSKTIEAESAIPESMKDRIQTAQSSGASGSKYVVGMPGAYTEAERQYLKFTYNAPADGSYQMSILKSADGNGESVQRYFFDYPQPVAGEGHFISTYKHNGSPIPSFEGEPLRFACPRTIGDFAHGLWQNLNPDNKVSLFARVIDLETGESGDMIFNKYDAVCSDLDDPEEPELLPEELELLKKLDAEEE